MVKILLVEDDPRISKLVVDYLKRNNFDVTAVTDGPAAMEWVQKDGLPHLALIDLSLPTLHGFALSSHLKKMGEVSILLITSNQDSDIILEGLRNYAEDFIVKPFELGELEARIGAILARMPSLDSASNPIVQVDDHLSIDFGHNRLEINGKAHDLTPTEAILLHALLRNAGHVVGNRMLIARVWSSEELNEDTLRVHMHRLRRKLESDTRSPHYIRTKRGVGYVFTVQKTDPHAD
ncbi:MAG UNVERIFIED_CONTAM: response regulator transcription factor [Anaerolineae bacterium]|jgi:DNA-binding response OmpR family regulator